MLNRKTTFIVGAGASSEVGMPVGSELRDMLCEKLNIRFKHPSNEMVSGDAMVYAAMKESVHSGIADGLSDAVHAAHRVCEALPTWKSIDEYIDNLDEKALIEAVAKLGIVRCILEKESASDLYFPTGYDEDGYKLSGKLSYSDIRDKWFGRFFDIIKSDLTANRVNEVFSNVSIISFNYDRTLEHFLFNALLLSYGLSESDAILVMDTLNIFHPFGVVGPLRWQNEDAGVEYGARVSAKALSELSRKIRTYSERVEEKDYINRMRSSISESEQIIILGFGFHIPNFELMNQFKAGKNKSVFMTLHGVSDSNKEVVCDRVRKYLLPSTGHSPINDRGYLRCFELLKEHSMQIAR